MTDIVKRLLSDEEIQGARDEGRSMAVRARGTCRHTANAQSSFARCGANGFYLTVSRGSSYLCGSSGRLWELKPPRHIGIFERVWRWLFGGESA